MSMYSNGENNTPLLAQAFIPAADLPLRVRVIIDAELAIGGLQVYIVASGGTALPGNPTHYVYFTGETETRELDFGSFAVDPGYYLRVEVGPLATTLGKFYVTIVTEAP